MEQKPSFSRSIFRYPRTLARALLPPRLRRVILRLLGQGVPASTAIQVLNGEVAPPLLRGWQAPVLARRQYQAFAPLLQQMYQGQPREDFVALAAAIEATGMEHPLILEVGCGSGWNAEVLAHLLQRPVRYIGMDYSSAMVHLGQHHYPDHSFVAGDATRLPFSNGSCDILVSGTVLLHLLGYREAIAESRRVARHWCVFHTVPLLQQKPTTMLRKNAYGEPVIEVVLNRAEFLDLIQKEGMAVKTVLETVPHPYLEDTLNTPVQVQTFLCQVLEKPPMKGGDATE